MTYGPNKIKDIAEGILPATRNAARAARRQRQAIHQAERSRSRAEQRRGDDGSLATTWARREVGMLMWRRRSFDNLASLHRWAERTTRHIDDPVARYEAVRAALPDNLIGRHALGHLAVRPGFADPAAERWRRLRWASDPEARAAARSRQQAERVAALRELAALDLAAVNRWLKDACCCSKPAAHAGGPCPHRPRLLAGIHDVEAFAEAEPLTTQSVVAALGRGRRG